jgi:GNAT superfamily N-acetyltransferase
MNIRYLVGERITVDEFIDVLNRSTLGERRPIDDRECITGMLENANLLVTAWDEQKLVGVSRSLTDFHYACYLSDLAVDLDYQKEGIGKRLIALTQEQLGPRCKIILLAAPAAVNYYPHIGFEHHPQAWILSREVTLSR